MKGLPLPLHRSSFYSPSILKGKGRGEKERDGIPFPHLSSFYSLAFFPLTQEREGGRKGKGVSPPHPYLFLASPFLFPPTLPVYLYVLCIMRGGFSDASPILLFAITKLVVRLSSCGAFGLVDFVPLGYSALLYTLNSLGCVQLHARRGLRASRFTCS